MTDTARDRWAFRRAGACCYRCDGFGALAKFRYRRIMGPGGNPLYETPCFNCAASGLDPLPWSELFVTGRLPRWPR